MTSTPESEGDLHEGEVGDSEVQLTVGMAACVWNHYLRRWTGGFAVAEVLTRGYRLRRLSDDYVFGHVFSTNEVMEERRKLQEPRVIWGQVDTGQQCEDRRSIWDVAQAGNFDDPVWTVEPPPVAIRTSRSRTKHHYWLYAAALVVLLAVGGWWLLGGTTKNSGDPGGSIMNQLTPAASALPGYGTTSLPWSSQPSISAPYLIKSEPRVDRCDGIAGTQGWSQVVVQGSFRWDGSHEALFLKIDSGLSVLGWHRTPIPSRGEAMWRKRLENGTIATAKLNLSPRGHPNWEFVALAPPAGRAVSRC